VMGRLRILSALTVGLPDDHDLRTEALNNIQHKNHSFEGCAGRI